LFDRRRLLVFACSVTVGALGCASRTRPSRVNLPPPSDRNLLGPSDVFTLVIVGEKDLPNEFQVASDGTVDLPYVKTLKVQGLEPQEVARLVRQRLIDEKILRDPTVVVQVKEYNSRKVTLLGQVAKPGAVPHTPGLTLIQAISMAGGLTSIANGENVRLTRTTAEGKTITVVLSVNAITDGDAEDIPLQSGDRIFVDERLF
jgi:protein involved in polysaccharide export with SLBB domain